MADLDTELSARLSRLAAAVPVATGKLDVVHRDAVRSRHQVRMAWLTPLVVVVVGGMLASALKVGPFGPAVTPEPSSTGEPISTSTRDGNFTLSIEATKSTYLEGEPISVSASLTYEGSGDQVVIAHYSGRDGSPIGFGVEEPIIGDWRLTPSWEGGCESVTMLPGSALVVPFEKRTPPLFDVAPGDVSDFLADPALHLPIGTWHLYAQAVFQPFDCRDGLVDPGFRVPIQMRVELEVEVLPRRGASLLPSSPVVDSDADGPFSLQLRSPRAVYTENEPIDVQGKFTYSGIEEISVRSDAFCPLTFSIGEPVYGLTTLGGCAIASVGYIGCPPNQVLSPGEQVASKFAISGFSPSPASPESTEQQRAWLADPVLRLPPGTWHFLVQSSLMPGPCGGPGSTSAPMETIELSAEIEIMVLPAASPSKPPMAEPTALPGGTEPPIRPTPEPPRDGSPIDTDSDGTFELRMDPESRVYRADEGIGLNVAYRYLGPHFNARVGNFAPDVAFSIWELDAEGNITGDIAHTKIYDSMCTERSLRAGIPMPTAISDANLMDIRVSSMPSFESGLLRLTPGRYRIGASMTTHLGGCRDGQPEPGQVHGLGVAVELVVVPATWSRLELLTFSQPAGACELARGGGTLEPNEISGIGVGGNGSHRAVRWPFGWTAWRDSSGVALLDAEGRIVAREGDEIHFAGAWVGDTFAACAGFELGP